MQYLTKEMDLEKKKTKEMYSLIVLFSLDYFDSCITNVSVHFCNLESKINP